jgi:hypothetical protein
MNNKKVQNLALYDIIRPFLRVIILETIRDEGNMSSYNTFFMYYSTVSTLSNLEKKSINIAYLQFWPLI